MSTALYLNRIYLPLLPVILMVMALLRVRPFLKIKLLLTEGVAFSCAGICFFIWFNTQENNLLILTAAFIFSIFGDLSMKKRITSGDYIRGIIFFFFAHICFLIYALVINRGLSLIALLVLLSIFLIYFNFGLLKSPRLIQNKVFAIAVLVYILVSCLSLSAAISPGHSGLSYWLFIAGIASMIVSDTFIGIRDFIRYKKFAFMIMPLYFLSQVLITLSVTVKF